MRWSFNTARGSDTVETDAALASLPPASPKAGYLDYIDGLRCLAVLLVLLFHANIGPFTGGFIGVDIFFVISGFLMTGILCRNPLDRAGLLKFAESRIRRIVPAYLACLLVVCGVGAFILLPTDLSRLAPSAISGPFFLTNVVLWRQADYFIPDLALRFPLLHTWSLGVEWQFYICLPILIVFARRTSLSLIVLFMGTALLSFIAGALLVRLSPLAAFYLLPPRAWEFLLGGLLALYGDRALAPRWLRELLGLAGLALVVVPAFLYEPTTTFPGPAALPPCIGTLLLLYACRQPITISPLLVNTPVRLLGQASYSIYLWHWPIILFAHYRWISEDSSLSRAIIIASSLAAGIVSWRFIELPYRLKRGQAAPRFSLRPLVIGSAVSMVAGLVFLATAGLPARFSAPVLAANGAESANGKFIYCIMSPLPMHGPRSPCRFGDPDATQTILLLGDSHAAALGAGLDMVAREKGRGGAMMLASACPPLLDFGGTYPPSRNRCRTIQSSILKVVSDLKPQIIILHAAWETFYDENPQAFRSDVDKTLAALQSFDAKVLVVGDVPGARVDVPLALARRLAFGLPLRIELEHAEYERRAAPVNAILSSAAHRYGAVFVDLGGEMCPQADCTVVENGKLLYIDKAHLSRAGSLYAASFLENQFR